MTLSFTGTRKGMTDRQKLAVVYILTTLQNKIDKYKHGDCVGSDVDFHTILTSSGFNHQVEIHPCNLVKQRAYCKAPKIHSSKDPLTRNKDMVAQSDILLATPGEEKEVLRSGTWATIRNAIKTNKRVIIVFPSGKYIKK